MKLSEEWSHFHVITARTKLALWIGQIVVLECSHEFSRTELRSQIRMDHSSIWRMEHHGARTAETATDPFLLVDGIAFNPIWDDVFNGTGVNLAVTSLTSGNVSSPQLIRPAGIEVSFDKIIVDG
jgi:hypothetical protein